MEARASFPPDPGSAAAARHFTERTLVEWDLPRLLETARLLVSELVMNAVIHARTASVLVLRAQGAGLRVEVSDLSPVLPRIGPRSQSAPSGRGLLILDGLADHWGVEVDGDAKTVWFELLLDPLMVAVDPHPGRVPGDGG